MSTRRLSSLLAFACALLATTQSLLAADSPKDLYDCCCDDCCKQSHITTDTKKVAKRVYGEKCQDFCLPHTHHRHGCDCCDCVTCGKIRTRKYLVVKIREHEECVNKCVVEHIPSRCAATSCAMASDTPVSDRSREVVSSPDGDARATGEVALNSSRSVGAWLKGGFLSPRQAR